MKLIQTYYPLVYVFLAPGVLTVRDVRAGIESSLEFSLDKPIQSGDGDHALKDHLLRLEGAVGGMLDALYQRRVIKPKPIIVFHSLTPLDDNAQQSEYKRMVIDAFLKKGASSVRIATIDSRLSDEELLGLGFESEKRNDVYAVTFVLASFLLYCIHLKYGN